MPRKKPARPLRPEYRVHYVVGVAPSDAFPPRLVVTPVCRFSLVPDAPELDSDQTGAAVEGLPSGSVSPPVIKHASVERASNAARRHLKFSLDTGAGILDGGQNYRLLDHELNGVPPGAGERALTDFATPLFQGISRRLNFGYRGKRPARAFAAAGLLMDGQATLLAKSKRHLYGRERAAHRG